MSLTYRKLLDPNGRFLPWVNQLCGKSGVYVIRGTILGTLLYVGESHTGNLSKTIKRHFWTWNDDPIRKHHVYLPAFCEVAVKVTPPGKAVEEQNRLIDRLRPQDNGRQEDQPF